MARLITTHPKTLPLDARLRGNPAISRKRSFGAAWQISMAVLGCLMA